MSVTPDDILRAVDAAIRANLRNAGDPTHPGDVIGHAASTVEAIYAFIDALPEGAFNTAPRGP